MGDGPTIRSSQWINKTKVEIKKIQKDVDALDIAIVKLETDRITGRSNYTDKQVDELIKSLGEKQKTLILKIDLLHNEIGQNTTKRKWVNWVADHGKTIEDLRNHQLTVKEKRDFMSSIIEQIVVHNPVVGTHELEIEFVLPFVDDQVKWKNSANKSKGYDLIDGDSKKKLVL